MKLKKELSKKPGTPLKPMSYTIKVKVNVETQGEVLPVEPQKSIKTKGSYTVRVTHGKSQRFEITPYDGYRVEAVLVDDKAINLQHQLAEIPDSNSFSYVFDDVTKNHSLTVSFAKLDEEDVIISASVRAMKVMTLIYSGHKRIVEPYSYGLTSLGNAVLRCYQVKGGSVSGQSQGWKLMKTALIGKMIVEDIDFEGTREGYNPNDSMMKTIFAAVALKDKKQ